MDAALLSLAVLLAMLAAAIVKESYVGFLAIAAAALLGTLSLRLPLDQLILAFPWSLFVTLTGVTLFFGLVRSTGALDRAVEWGLRLTRGNVKGLPWVFFGLGLVLAAVGAGNIAAVAVLAPLTMSAARHLGISRFFMALMLVNGANAGTFSPFSPTGIIAMRSSARFGLQMEPWSQLFLPSLLAQSFVAAVWFIVLAPSMRPNAGRPDLMAAGPVTAHQRIALALLPLFVLAVAVFDADVGHTGLAFALVLGTVLRPGLRPALKRVPWRVVLLVCGFSFLIAIVEKAGGLAHVTDLLARVSNPVSATGVLAVVAGVLSSFSSSSGVVMPALIPLVPQLIQEMGGGEAAALVASINVGSHVVDVSPLSTLGALCVAAAAGEKERLFRKLLIAGLSMTLFGAAVCYVFFGLGGKYFLG